MTKKQNVSQQLLDTSTRLFARHGYEGTSLKSIAEDVGIRKASLLYHFESKDVLRQAVLERLFGHWSEAVPRLLAAATSGPDRFDALMDEATQFFVTDPNRARLIMREMLDRPAFMNGLIASYLRPWLTIVGNYIEQGQREGILYPDVDADAYVLQTIQMLLTSVAVHDVMDGLYDDEAQLYLTRHLNEMIRIAKCSLFIDIQEVKDEQ